MLTFLALLATYRLAYLFAIDRGPFDCITMFRSWILRLCDLNARHWLYDGLTCVRCLSWWLALPCVALVTWGGIVGGAVVAWWGVAGGVLVLAQVLDALRTEQRMRDIREELADYSHGAWSGMMRYLFRFGTQNDDGTFLMDADKVTRWRRQMDTPYAALSEAEKDSDRKEADAILTIINT